MTGVQTCALPISIHDYGTLDILSSHGLIEIHRYSGVEKLSGSHQALEMVPLEQSQRISKVWLLSHSLYLEVELRVKWFGSTIQITRNGRRSNHWSLDDDFRSGA